SGLPSQARTLPGAIARATKPHASAEYTFIFQTDFESCFCKVPAPLANILDADLAMSGCAVHAGRTGSANLGVRLNKSRLQNGNVQPNGNIFLPIEPAQKLICSRRRQQIVVTVIFRLQRV